MALHSNFRVFCVANRGGMALQVASSVLYLFALPLFPVFLLPLQPPQRGHHLGGISRPGGRRTHSATETVVGSVQRLCFVVLPQAQRRAESAMVSESNAKFLNALR